MTPYLPHFHPESVGGLHIFDFEKDIYGRRITVQFIEKIREEVKFDSIDLLKSQIKKDIEEAKKILN